MWRTARTRSSSKVCVPIRALDGSIAMKLSFMFRARIACEAAIMPTANTPTAIDNTTSRVRVLLPHKSRRTLLQHGLSTRHLQRFLRMEDGGWRMEDERRAIFDL